MELDDAPDRAFYFYSIFNGGRIVNDGALSGRASLPTEVSCSMTSNLGLKSLTSGAWRSMTTAPRRGLPHRALR